MVEQLLRIGFNLNYTDMVNYEIQGRLDKKANLHEVHALQAENRELRGVIQALEEKLNKVEAMCSRYQYVLERFIDLVADQEFRTEEVDYQLYELKSTL